jgi:PRTRC genetic system protein B
MITVYRNGAVEGYNADYYLESHDVDSHGKVMAGKPLLQETIQGMVDVFFDENQNRSRISGMIPEELLQYEPQPGGYFSLAWYRPAEKRTILFAKQLKLKSGVIWTPPMVYRVTRKELWVFALKSSRRPVEGTKLLRAPFHNVADDGHVCLGSAKVARPTEKSFRAWIKYWEDLFWLSEFTHLNGASNPTKSPLAKVMTRLVNSKGRIKWNDMDELREMKGITLKKVLK